MSSLLDMVYESLVLDTDSFQKVVLFSNKQVNKWKSDDKSLGNTSFGIVTLLMASALSPQLTLLPFTSV
jgi:hypothetical protein